MIDLLTTTGKTTPNIYTTFSKVNNDIDLIKLYNLEYKNEFDTIKLNDIEYIEFEIVATGDTNFINNSTLSFTNLKYDKNFIFNISSNGGYHGIYNYIQKYVSNRYVETGNTENHDGQIRTSGLKSNKILGFTDSISNEIIPFKTTLYYDKISQSGTTTDEFITKNEVQTFIDFFGEVGIDGYQILTGNTGSLYINEKIRTVLYDYNYNISSSNSNLYINRCEVMDGDIITLNDSMDLKNIGLYKNKNNTTIDNGYLKYNEINLNKISIENISSLYLLLDNLNNTYGVDGSDTVWSATPHEVFEWLFIKRHSKIEKKINTNGTVNFSVIIPKTKNFKSNSITLTLNITPSDLNIYGKYINKNNGVYNNKYLINIFYDFNIISKIEKYLTIAENNLNSPYYQDYKNDVTFFYNKIDEDNKKYYNFKNRYNNL